MAGSGSDGFAGGRDPLFVSPDSLVMDPELNEQRYQASSSGTDSRHSPTGSASFEDAPRPSWSLPTHGLPDWILSSSSTAHAHAFPTLPPTPMSPFRPLRPWSEDEKLAFPCLGGPEDCWNSQLCPKHRRPHHPETSPPSDHARPHLPRTTPHSRRPSEAENPHDHHHHRGGGSSSSSSATTKPKRHHAPDSSDNDAEPPSRPPAIRANREARTSLSRGRVPHNLVERRYRDNLNNQIEALRRTLPTLQDAHLHHNGNGNSNSNDGDDDPPGGGGGGPRMPSKAVIIATAAAHIQELERERTRLRDANRALHEQVASLQKLLLLRGGGGGGGGEEPHLLQYINALRVMAAGQLPPTPL